MIKEYSVLIMQALGMTNGQKQINALVEVCAAELFVPEANWDRAYIDWRTDASRAPLIEVAEDVGQRIFTLMQPSPLNPDGVHQREVESLTTGFRDEDLKQTNARNRWWYHSEHNVGLEYNHLILVTARLGRKSTSRALALWSDR